MMKIYRQSSLFCKAMASENRKRGMAMKKTGILLLCFVRLLFASCAKGAAHETGVTLNPARLPVETYGPYVPGTYSAAEEGYGGTVTVTMTFSGENITEIRITCENETQNVGTKAMDELAALMLEAQTAEVDTVSGATVTSNAVIAAAENCIAQAKAGL